MFRRLCLFPSIILFFSCASLSPVSGSYERAAVRVETLGDVVPQWQGFARNLGSGVDYFAGRVRDPRLEFWALRVDLSDPSLDVVINGEGAAAGIMPSTTVSGFVRRYGCIAGINATPFSPVSAREDEERTIVGIAVSESRIIAEARPPYDALVFYDTDPAQQAVDHRSIDHRSVDRRAAIVSQGELENLEGIRTALGGFYRVLQDGAVTEAVAARSGQRHPRSAAGLSADGSTLYLLVVDGRRPGSVGATEAELALLLLRLGASQGLNLDGGGSSAMALRYSDGRLDTVNKPAHRHIPGWERAVAVCLGIVMKKGF